jgi:uncharacterized 2Fe-2S/4Fe-4S cluster protein (DUF4445 family)
VSKVPYAKTHTITVYPGELTFQAEPGINLFSFLTSKGYSIPNACGGMGTCGKCRVIIYDGIRPPSESEEAHLSKKELKNGWRLCCRQRIDRDISLRVFERDEISTAKEELKYELKIKLDPGMIKVHKTVAKPGHTDQRADTLRIQEEFCHRQAEFSLQALRKLPHVLRENDFEVTVTCENERVLDVEPGNTEEELYGLAVDIGTTTLAGYLLNLKNGDELAVNSRMNPQQRLGADVISRIKKVHEEGEEGVLILQEAVKEGIDALISQTCNLAKVDPQSIYKATFVGNPTMLHFLTTVSPRFIDHSPYIPVLQEGLRIPCDQLGFNMNPEATTYIFPSISGYVGGDITAGILFTGFHKHKTLSLLIDIGTNAEIVLGNREAMLSCSTPAGPAFEGARIKHGMSAVPGAIAHATFGEDGEGIDLEVVGNEVPWGICGSGLIDLVAELLKVGIIDNKGTLKEDSDSPYQRYVEEDEEGMLQFLVTREYRDIYLTQKDIRELQLAKGAIRAGINIVLEEWGASYEDVGAVYLAGAFGNYVRRESILRLGMLPPFRLPIVRTVGNAAGQGAKIGLLNRKKWAEVKRLTRRIRYFELSYLPSFSDAFMDSMMFFDSETHRQF